MPHPISISVVVPNYNGGRTIDATLRSLVEQNYPDLQIIVVDGGSTDHSVDIIRQYEKHLHWWVSEKDAGQSDAINKGLARCTGEVVNWLCSDDTLQVGALDAIDRHFQEHPDSDILAGMTRYVFTRDGVEVNSLLHGPRDPGAIKLMPCVCPISQPSCFYRRKLLTRSPPIDARFHYAMDFDLWMNFKKNGARWTVTDRVLATALMDGTNKTSVGGWKFIAEWEKVYRAHVREPLPLTYWHRHLRHPLQVWARRHPHTLRGRIAPALSGLTDWALTPFYGYWRVRVMDWTWAV